MFKQAKSISKFSKKGSLFIGGFLFGSAGFKLLSSKEAKNIYSHGLSKAFKIKDSIDTSLSAIKQHADDVQANARDIYYREEKNSNLEMINVDAEENLIDNDAKL